MKSPTDMTLQLLKQWRSPKIRADRLLRKESWPIKLRIGKPTVSDVMNTTDLADHMNHWRSIKSAEIGKLTYKAIRFQSLTGLIDVPIEWSLEKPSDWINAINLYDSSISITEEFETLSTIIQSVDEIFHEPLIRKLDYCLAHSTNEIIKLCKLALILKPGIANGKPLRTINIINIDTKFFERHENILIELLKERFDSTLLKSGLRSFLGVYNENEPWILIKDLDGRVLPTSQMKIQTSSLDSKDIKFNASNILIIENEQCHHLLPTMNSTLAILGAGNNLNWMKADWLNDKNIAYWGDIDTWGLNILNSAKDYRPDLTALLMTKTTFKSCKEHSATKEERKGSESRLYNLTPSEKSLFHYLSQQDKGRVEQEFLSEKLVIKELSTWLYSTTTLGK